MLIALKKGPALVVLTGDHKQLPPTVVSLGTGHNPYAPRLATSLFERLVGRDYSFHMLKAQYRMHPHISAQPNRTTYGGKLLKHPSTSAVIPLSLLFEDFVRRHPRLGRAGNKRRIVIDVPGASVQPRGSYSYYNEGQVRVIDDPLHDLLNFRSEAEGDTNDRRLVNHSLTWRVAPLSPSTKDFIMMHARLEELGSKKRTVIDVPGAPPDQLG